MLQDLQAPSPYAIGRHGTARNAMLTHLYQGYNGEPHLSFAVHLTQVRHTSQPVDKCGVSGCLSALLSVWQEQGSFETSNYCCIFWKFG